MPRGTPARPSARASPTSSSSATSTRRPGSGLRGRRVGGGKPHILFLGHIDTVPGFWPPRTEDGHVHARGAVDAKRALAAGLLAAAKVGPSARGTRTVVAAVGEETDSRGVFELLRRPPPPPARP